MKIKSFYIAVIATCLFGCNENIDEITSSQLNSDAKLKSYGDNLYDMLGCGFDPTLGYLNKVGERKLVIDIDRLRTEKPDEFNATYPNESSGNLTAGSNYLEISKKMTSKFSSGPTTLLPIGISSETTASQKTSSKYSYATYFYRKSIKQMKLYKDLSILRSFVTNEFTSTVNTKSNSYIIENYGTHVYTDITIGGVIEANYKSYANSYITKN